MNRFIPTIGILWLCAVATALVSIPATAAVIGVPGDQPTIQAAITAAAPGDTILIADGTYSGPGNINVDPAGKDVIIQSENGPGACIIDCGNTARAFYIHSGESNAFVIDGLRIINGYDSLAGGGIYCRQYSSPIITNCEFIDCVSGDDGGGIYITFHCNPLVSNCLFQNNTAVYGGGLAVGSSSNVTVTGCVFQDNIGTQGGGLRVSGNQPVSVSGCTFTNNSASALGGGISVLNNPDFSLENCTFTGNSALDGGALNMEFVSTALLNTCTFTANQATNLGGAVRMLLAGNSATVTHCDFISNSLPQTATTEGGGMYVSGAQTISDCTFTGNTAYRAGGLRCAGASRVSDCVFQQNICAEWGGGCITPTRPRDTIPSWSAAISLTTRAAPVRECTRLRIPQTPHTFTNAGSVATRPYISAVLFTPIAGHLISPTACSTTTRYPPVTAAERIPRPVR
ncbi:MAG TPA: right-handed parallel beta-helix repeat-containing protein [bacterium]|nr:right-handed parallel beta-helix repeat-containing protein [bacterium]